MSEHTHHALFRNDNLMLLVVGTKQQAEKALTRLKEDFISKLTDREKTVYGLHFHIRNDFEVENGQ